MSTDGLEQSGSPPLTFEQRAHFYEEEVDLSRLATEARRRGDYHNALRAYFQLIPVQDRLYTTNSVQVARSFNAVGECTLALGRPDAAEESFDQALGVRETAEYGGMGLGERWDAVVSRDNMAKVREVQGKLLEARKLRLRGKDSDMLCCSNSEVRLPLNVIFYSKHVLLVSCTNSEDIGSTEPMWRLQMFILLQHRMSGKISPSLLELRRCHNSWPLNL